MWTSLEDMVEDLVKLNDFEIPEKVESYKSFLFRSLKPEWKSNTDYKENVAFLDPRTGEKIECIPEKDEKQREIGFYSKSLQALQNDNELQNQLQNVRKIRPSDEEIEVYISTIAVEEEETASDFISDKSELEDVNWNFKTSANVRNNKSKIQETQTHLNEL